MLERALDENNFVLFIGQSDILQASISGKHINPICVSIADKVPCNNRYKVNFILENRMLLSMEKT